MTEVAKIDPKNSPAQMIREAVAGGADLEKLKGLLELQERWELNESRKAFFEAMAMFSANAPEIEKDKEVSFGTTKYRHATLSNVTKKVREELSKWGLSANWKMAQTNGSVTVTCVITHKQGYSQETTLSASVDSSGSKNAIQAVGSTVTYLERYTLLAATGLATSEMDDDGRGTAGDIISDKELSQLRDLLAEKNANEEKFCEYMKIDSLEKLPKSRYQQALAAIKAKPMPKAATR